MTYQEQIKDPRWQKKRLKILNRDKFKCKSCGNTKKTLHVHHNYYLNNREIWDYLDSALYTLCEDCHSRIHKMKKNYERTNDFNLDRIMNLGILIHSRNTQYSVDFLLLIRTNCRSIIFEDSSESYSNDDMEIKAIDILENAVSINIDHDDFALYVKACFSCDKIISKRVFKKFKGNKK